MSTIKTVFSVKPEKDPSAEIIASRIISQAKSKNADGSVTIVAVFELSTYHKFFHVFTAPSKRTPRRKWIYKSQYIGIYSGTFYTLRSLLASRHPFSAGTWTVRHIHGARTLADLTRRISNPIQGYIAPIRIHVQPAQAGY